MDILGTVAILAAAVATAAIQLWGPARSVRGEMTALRSDLTEQVAEVAKNVVQLARDNATAHARLHERDDGIGQRVAALEGRLAGPPAPTPGRNGVPVAP